MMNGELKPRNQEALLEYLDRYVQSMGSAGSSDDLFALAAERLRQALDAVAVVLFAYEEETGAMGVLHTTLQPGESLKLSQILGRGLEGAPWNLTSDARERLSSERVILMPGVSAMSFGVVPPTLGALIDRAFGLGWLAALALQHDDVFMGAAVIAWEAGFQPPDPEGLCIFAGVTGSAIRRWRAERALRESEQRWQFALEGAGDGIWDWNVQTDMVFFSRQWKAMLGYAEHEITNSLGEWSKRVHPEDQAACYAALDRHFSGETPVYQNEHRLQCKDGSYKWILDRGKIVEWTADGRPLRVIGTHTDITAHKQAEAKLQQLKEFNESIVLNMTEGIVMTDVEGKIAFVNPAMATMLGCSPKDLIGQSWMIFVPPASQAIVQAADARRVRGQSDRYELEIKGKDDRVLSTLVSGGPYFDPKTGTFSGTLAVFTNITERRQAEEALRLQSLVLDQIQDHVTITDLGGHITYVNDIESKALRFPREALIGLSVEAYGEDPAKGATQREIIEATLKNGYWRGEVVNYASDGTEIILDARTQLIYDGDGAPLVLCGISTDITERKRAEAALQEREAKLQSIFRAAPIGIGMVISRIVMEANDTLCAMTGYTRDELLGQSARLLYPSDEDFAYVGQEKYRQIHIQGFGTVETRWRRKDGQIVDILLSSAVLDPTDLQKGATFTALDITERKRAEAELRHRAVALEGLNDTALALAAQQDLKTLLQIIVEHSLRMLEAQVGSIYLYRALTDDLEQHFVCGRDTPHGDHVLQRGEGLASRVLDSRQTLIVNEFTDGDSHTPSDSGIACVIIGVPIVWRTRPLGVLLLSDDSPRTFSESDQMLLESLASLAAAALENNRLLETEREQRHLAETLREVAAVLGSSLNRERVLTLILEQLARVIAYDSASIMLVGETTLNIVAARGFHSRSQWDVGLRAEALEHIQTVLEERKPVIIFDTKTDTRWQCLPGSEYIRSWIGVPLVVQDQVIGLLNLDSAAPHFYRPAHGELAATFANQAALAIENARLYDDVRQRVDALHQTQAQLVQSAKMAAIGRLAAGVAHELNNPLTAILLSARSLSRNMQSQSEEHRELTTITSEAHRAADIVRGLLDFSRQTELRREWVDVNQVLQESLALVRQLIAQRGIIIQELYAPDLPRLYLDINRMKQVFLNIITNAVDAMQAEGQLTLASERAGSEISVRIRDTGAGISPEHRARLFEPFFTTKPVGEGTGLGLPVSLGIVQDHGGRIEVESHVGEGSCFSVILPVIPTGKQQLLSEERLG